MKKKDIYIQDSISSCGASCIRSVVSFYGGYVPLETVLSDTLTDKSGTNAYHMVRALNKYGFDSYGCNIPIDDIDIDRLPVIAHLRKEGYEHFVVVYEIHEDKILVMDPEYGKKEYEKEYFKSIYDEKAIFMTPNGQVIEVKKSLSLYKLLLPLIKKKVTIISLFLIVSTVLVIISLLLSFHLKLLNMTDDPLILTILFVCLKLFTILLLHLKTVLNNRLTKYLDSHSFEMVLEHIFALPIRYLKNRRVGEIVNKLSNTGEIKNLLVRIFTIGPIDLFLFILVLIAMFSISYKLTLVYLFVILIYILITLLSKKKLYTLTKKNTDSYEEYTGLLVEYMNGIESIKNLSKEKLFLKRLKTSLDNYLDVSIKSNEKENLIYLFKDNILEISSILVTFIGFMSLSESFTIVDLMTFGSLFSLLYSSIENMIDMVTEIFKSRVSSRNICEFLDLEEERTMEHHKEKFTGLSIRNLRYSYDFIHETLNGVSLDLTRGEKILLGGPSGVGKSTLVKCIGGKLENYTGDISLNGVDIRNISLEDIRRNIVYIGQEESLFRDSLKENIVLGDYDEEKFSYVCRLTKVDEILNKRIDRENTVLLEGAANISGGEKARIILARALYRNPNVLIIDETLSSISEELENEIIENLNKLENLSLIYITHRDKSKQFKKIMTL